MQPEPPHLEPQADEPPPQPFAAQTDGKALDGDSAFKKIVQWTQHHSASASALATAALSPAAVTTERAQINELFLKTAGRAQEDARVTEGALIIPSPPCPFLYPIPPHLQPYKIYVRTYVHNV